MDNFEIGRIIGNLEIILKDIPNIEEELDSLENDLKFEHDIMQLARTYGRIEQKMLLANKEIKDINILKNIFEEIKEKRINSFKQKNIEDLRIHGIPIKILNNNGIFTIQDFCNKSFKELTSITGISEYTIERIIKRLSLNCIEIKK